MIRDWFDKDLVAKDVKNLWEKEIDADTHSVGGTTTKRWWIIEAALHNPRSAKGKSPHTPSAWD
jgi:hypothetical protein